MDKDRLLFQAVKNSSENPYLRFYSWDTPTLSYGRTQGMDIQTQTDFLAKGWNIARRPTGGGRVLHQRDLCFTVAWRKENSELPWKVMDSYCAIHTWLKNSLETVGYTLESCPDAKSSNPESWCFQSPVAHDILKEGQKIIGGAQWREGSAALHQGSIQLEKLVSVTPVSSLISILKTTFQSTFKVQFYEEALCSSNN